MFQQLFERLFLLMYFSLPVYGTIKYTTNIYVFKVWNSCIQLINLYALLYVNILGRTLCKVSFAPTSLDMSFLLYFLIPLCLNTVQDRRFSKGYRGNTTQKTQANKLINISVFFQTMWHGAYKNTIMLRLLKSIYTEQKQVDVRLEPASWGWQKIIHVKAFLLTSD